jgi:DNA-binding LacI/PurR family transcriptional regulator
VVRNTHLVGAQTAERVRRAIAKLGYRPDPALSALAAYRSSEGGGRGSVLAFLDCDQTPYSGMVLKGARREALLLGYSMERIVLPAQADRQRQLARMLFHRGVRGLIFGPSDDFWEFSGWDWEQFAAVSLGAVVHRPALHSVTADYFHSAEDGCRLLREKGCRKIGLVVEAKLEARTGHRWLGGFLAANAGISSAVFQGQLQKSSDLKAWAKRERIDGILTIHFEVWHPLRNAGICFAFLNDSVTPPGQTFLALNRDRIGGEGVRLLHHLLLRREFGLPEEPKRVALQGRWSETFPGSA